MSLLLLLCFEISNLLLEEESTEEHHTCGTWHGFQISSGNMNQLYMELVQNSTTAPPAHSWHTPLKLQLGFSTPLWLWR
jgi:hypothetical protein